MMLLFLSLLFLPPAKVELTLLPSSLPPSRTNASPQLESKLQPGGDFVSNDKPVTKTEIDAGTGLSSGIGVL